MSEACSTTYHVRIDIRGALSNWHSSEWKNCVRSDDGHTMTPEEVKEEFFNLLQAGVRFIPFGSCSRFDPERGCLGHREDSDGGVR